MSKNKIIIKSFIDDKRNVIFPIFISTIILTVIFLGTFLLKIQLNSSIESAYYEYGKYIFAIGDDNVENIQLDMSKVSNKLYINKQSITDENEDGDNKYYYFIDASEEIVDFYNFNLVKGKCPSKSGEILIDRKWLYANGYMTDDVIGKDINITINDEYYTYNVSGIITNSTVTEDNSSYYIITNEKKKANQVLLSLKDLRDFSSMAEMYEEKYGDNLFVNVNLVFFLWLNEKISYVDVMYMVFWLFYLFIVVAAGILLFLIFNYILRHNETTVRIFNMLGISKSSVWNNFNVCIFVAEIISLLLSLIMGNGIFVFLYYVMMDRINPISYYYNQFPIQLYIESILVFFIFIEIILLANRKVSFVYSKKYQVRRKKKHKSIFAFKNRFYNIDLAFKSIGSKKIYSLFVIVGIAAVCFMVIMGSYYKTLIKMQQKEYSDASYMIEFPEIAIYDPNAVSEYKGVINTLYNNMDKYDFKMYELYEDSIRANINIEYLDDRYLDTLYNDIDSIVSMLQGNKIAKNIIVLGYTDEELKELSRMNGGIDTNLKDNEALVVNRVLAPNGIETIPMNITANDNINITYINADYEEEAGCITIKDKVKKLPVLPQLTDYEICFIVSMDFYQKISNMHMPDRIYIYEEYDAKNSILNEIKGKQYCEIYNVRDERQENENYNRILNSIIYIITILTIAIVFIIVLVVNVTQIDLRKKELSMYRAIGISDFMAISTILIEMFFYWIVGELMAVGVCKLIIKYQEIKNVDMLNISLIEFPYDSLLKISLAIVLIITFVSTLLVAYLKKNNLIENLRSN